MPATWRWPLVAPFAARDWSQLASTFARRFSTETCLTHSYRSYESQTRLYGAKPTLAAVPGTSNHGWGVTLDVCGGQETYDSERHQGLRRHNARFGWVNPGQEGGSRPEPWH